MGALSPAHLVIILVVALLVIGPGKLPETGAALGRAIRDLRQALEGKDEQPEAGDGTGERS
jgi:sec-independent protein translocase protein TatA